MCMMVGSITRKESFWVVFVTSNGYFLVGSVTNILCFWVGSVTKCIKFVTN